MTYSIEVKKFNEVFESGLNKLMEEAYNDTLSKFYGEHKLKYNPNICAYLDSDRNNSLISYLLYFDDKLVGYCNIFLYEDLFTKVLSAQEDIIYVKKDYRNGIGTKFLKGIMQDLNSRGVFMIGMSPMGVDRLSKILYRLGFNTVSSYMRYIFKGK